MNRSLLLLPLLMIASLTGLRVIAQELPITVKPFTSVKPPPGTYRTSWIGNSFGGNGGPNGFGSWVQNGADEIEVTPDGTVFAGVEWDEAGRCVGLYKDGKANRVLLQAKGDGLPDSAWGWGTGNRALAVSGNQIFIANTGQKLLRFHWTPGDLNSASFVDSANLPDEAMGLTARGDRLVVVYANRIELRREKDLAVTGGFDLKDAKDTALSATGNLWVLAGHTVRRYTPEGKDTGIALPGLGSPTSLSFDNRGRLLVTDNGPRQQVLFYDVSHTPKLVATFGEKGGLLSGVPGLVTPKKLFALVGAGTDAKGNLTVGMSFGNGPNGHCFLRSFTPAGNLRWELYNASFVDTYGFDPASDGSVVYGRTAAFDLDLTRTKPGGEATLKAITLDPLHHSDDPRQKYGSTAILRRPGGKRVLYTIGQYAGGYRLYTFDEPNGYLAHPVDQIGPKKGEGEQWAWDVDARGDIWHGDAPGKTIRRYAFKGWNGKKPVYEWAHPESWPWPDGWEIVRRIQYDVEEDTLYLSGYLKGERVES
jgi:hypothetical protein